MAWVQLEDNLWSHPLNNLLQHNPQGMAGTLPTAEAQIPK